MKNNFILLVFGFILIIIGIQGLWSDLWLTSVFSLIFTVMTATLGIVVRHFNRQLEASERRSIIIIKLLAP